VCIHALHDEARKLPSVTYVRSPPSAHAADWQRNLPMSVSRMSVSCALRWSH
jgi:hypothetical protein